MKKITLLFFLTGFAPGVYTQVGISTTSPNSTLYERGCLPVETSTSTSRIAVSKNQKNGFIAQEKGKPLTEIVSGDPNRQRMEMKYAGSVPVSVNLIKK